MFRLLGSLSIPAIILPTVVCATQNNAKLTIQQVVGGRKFFSGPLEALRSHQKYASEGTEIPPDVVKAAKWALEVGRTGASPAQYDQYYVSEVKIGDQVLYLDIDTGSADLWVFSTALPSNMTEGHRLYNASASSTASLLKGYSWSIGYGAGAAAAGVVYTDDVSVEGATATAQAVQVATAVAGQFIDTTARDGFMGLAFSTINTVQPVQQKTFFETLAPSLWQKLFTASLKRGAAGSYNFGFIDYSKISGQIAYTEVNDTQGNWQLDVGGYSIGNDTQISGHIGNAIVDTGSSLVYLPSQIIQSYYAQVDGASLNPDVGGYTFACNASLNDLHLSIGQGTFRLPGAYINYAPIDSSGETCYGGIQDDIAIGFSILGDIFLKSVFVVFDMTSASPRIGFATPRVADYEWR